MIRYEQRTDFNLVPIIIEKIKINKFVFINIALN